MQPRVLFISTYSELTLIAKQLSKELNIPMCVKEGGFMKDGHLYAKKMADQFDVIISSGGTAAAINDLVKTIPIISIQCTASDVLKALGEAIKFKKPLALISYRSDELYELERLTKLLNNIEYKVFAYSNKEEFQEQICKAMDLVEHTLVGMGNCIQDLAHQRDLNYILVKPSYKTIKQAIISAKNIIELTNKDKFRTERLKSIINYSSEGILSIDKTGNITIFNSVAEKILGLNAQTVMNENIFNPHISNHLKALYGNGLFEVNKLEKVGNIHLVLNRIPIKINNEYEETIITFQKVSYIQKMEHNARMQLNAKGLVAKNTFNNIIGISNSIQNTVNRALRFSKTSATVLIEGETGTGKELFAQGIHNASPRKNGPFVAINCAALPENLLESELFGYEEGAFTGAKKGGKAGLFELAHNGTIFLDEIGEISPSLQSRLLRVLQEKSIRRIGGDRFMHVNVRILAATNKNLYKMMTEEKFRPDLYFRLNILNLKIAPLRKRKEDFPCLIKYFINSSNCKYNTTIKAISPKGIELLQNYYWPGNVRELETFLEKLVILSDNDVISELLISSILQEYAGNQSITKINDPEKVTIDVGSLEDMEIQIIKKLLQLVNGNKQLAAKKLGISRATIWNYLKKSTLHDM